MENVSHNLDPNTVEPCPFRIVVLPFGIIVTCGGCIGLIGNILILFSIPRPTTSLNSSCYKFMGHLALADAISSLGFVIYGLTAIGGFTCGSPATLTIWQCFLINIPFIVSFNAGCFLILIVGIDRFLAITQTSRYSKLSRAHLYLIGMSLPAWLYSTLFLIPAYIYADSEAVVPTCVLPTSLNGLANLIWAVTNIALNISVVLVYLFVTWKTHQLNHQRSRRRRNGRIHRTAQKVLRSLLLVMIVYVGSWCVTMLAIFLSTILEASDSLIFHASLYVGILANVNVASNFFIYSFRSEDYRREFGRILPRFFPEVDLKSASIFEGMSSFRSSTYRSRNQRTSPENSGSNLRHSEF